MRWHDLDRVDRINKTIRLQCVAHGKLQRRIIMICVHRDADRSERVSVLHYDWLHEPLFKQYSV